MRRTFAGRDFYACAGVGAAAMMGDASASLDESAAEVEVARKPDAL